MGDNTHLVLMLVGNKCDLVNERQVSTEEGKKEAEMNGMAFMETSALDGTNITEAFELMAKLITEKQMSIGNLGLRDESPENKGDISNKAKTIEVNSKAGEKEKCCGK